ELARAGQGPHGSEVGDRAGAGPAGPHEQGSRPLMTDDLVAGLSPRTWPSVPTPTHTSPPDVQFSRCTLLTVDRQGAVRPWPSGPRGGAGSTDRGQAVTGHRSAVGGRRSPAAGCVGTAGPTRRCPAARSTRHARRLPAARNAWPRAATPAPRSVGCGRRQTAPGALGTPGDNRPLGT